MPSTKLKAATANGPPEMQDYTNRYSRHNPVKGLCQDIPAEERAATTAASGTVDTRSQQLQQKLAQMVLIIGDVSKDIGNLGDKVKTPSSTRYQDRPHGDSKTNFVAHPNTYESKVNRTGAIEIWEKRLRELESENVKLTEQLRDVIAMNTRWQLYDGQREDYVVQLNLKLTALQKEMDELCAQEKVAKDNADHAEVSSKEEKIQALEYQVKTSQEDFELERMDRARVQGQLQELKEKFEEAERDNKQQKDLIFFYQAQLGELRRGFDEPDRRARYQRNINRPRYQHYQRRFGGGLSDNVEVDDVNDFDFVDSSASATSTQKLFEDSLPSDDVEVDGNVTDEVDGGVVELLCPKCSKHFAYSEHDKLVDHMDRC